MSIAEPFPPSNSHVLLLFIYFLFLCWCLCLAFFRWNCLIRMISTATSTLLLLSLGVPEVILENAWSLQSSQNASFLRSGHFSNQEVKFWFMETSRWWALIYSAGGKELAGPDLQNRFHHRLRNTSQRLASFQLLFRSLKWDTQGGQVNTVGTGRCRVPIAPLHLSKFVSSPQTYFQF